MEKYAKLIEIFKEYRGNNIIFTNGVFDLGLHPGHIDTINFCRDLAGPEGIVVIAINSDNSVKKIKGKNRPIYDQNARCKIISALSAVDFVIVFDEETPEKLIELIKPTHIVKGGDYTKENVVGGDKVPVFLAPYSPEWSTSKTIEKILNKQK